MLVATRRFKFLMLPTHRDGQRAVAPSSPDSGQTSRPPYIFGPSSHSLKGLKSSWKTIAALVITQCLITTIASFVGSGTKPHEATNTELVYGGFFLLSPFIFLTIQTNSIFGVLLSIYNAILLAALMGWPQEWSSKISRKELFIHAIGIFGVVGMRMLLGYLFSRGTGFAYPLFFFNDAIHETTCGLSVITLYCITHRAYTQPAEQSDRLFKFLPTSFLLWTPNALTGPVFFWSFSTISITGIQGLLSLLLEGREATWSISRRRSAEKASRLTRFLTMLQIFLVLSAIFAIINYLHSLVYHYYHTLHTLQAANLPEPVLTQFLLLSYPRRNDSTLLSSTLKSYTPNLGSRFHANVYTTIAPVSHPAFSQAQTTFRGSPGLEFFADPEPVPLLLRRPVIPGYLPGKQTFDLYSALSWVERNIASNATRYLGIMEDDFEWCKDGWNELKAILYEVALRESSQPSEGEFCGIFVATGGSGLIVRPSIISLLRNALRTYAFDFNTDIILQDCLRGSLPLCSECKLAASRRLLFRHTGASQSTYLGRVYPEDRWQCGWRQPFNGKLGVWVP